MTRDIIHEQKNIPFVKFHLSVDFLKPIRKNLGIHPCFITAIHWTPSWLILIL